MRAVRRPVRRIITSDRFAPSIAMAAKSFERIVLSRARSAASGGQGPLTKQSFRNTQPPLRSTACSDRKDETQVAASYLLRGRSLLHPTRLAADERHPHHVGGAGRAERDAGDDDDTLAGLGKAFLEGKAAGAFHHVVLVMRVLSDDAVDAPDDRQLTARGDD